MRTGDIRGAGTDANVFVRIFGETGETGKLQLRQADNTKDKWERGRTDMFTLEAMDIGKVCTIFFFYKIPTTTFKEAFHIIKIKANHKKKMFISANLFDTKCHHQATKQFMYYGLEK